MGGLYSQLAGMIEMTHVVLRLLDTLTKEEGALRVSLFSLPFSFPLSTSP
jgi:hypothetical protein